MAAQPGTAIAIEATSELPCVCDPDRIAQVLSNVIANAIHHGTDAQAIRVRVDGSGPRSCGSW